MTNYPEIEETLNHVAKLLNTQPEHIPKILNRMINDLIKWRPILAMAGKSTDDIDKVLEKLNRRPTYGSAFSRLA